MTYGFFPWWLCCLWWLASVILPTFLLPPSCACCNPVLNQVEMPGRRKQMPTALVPSFFHCPSQHTNTPPKQQCSGARWWQGPRDYQRGWPHFRNCFFNSCKRESRRTIFWLSCHVKPSPNHPLPSIWPLNVTYDQADSPWVYSKLSTRKTIPSLQQTSYLLLYSLALVWYAHWRSYWF